MAEVSDGYILADGEALMVGLTFMDARRMVRDARGEPPGTRPGFLLSDNEADEQARDDAYQQYAADISQRWRQGPEHRSSPKQAESQAFTNRKPPSPPPMRNITGTSRSVGVNDRL